MVAEVPKKQNAAPAMPGVARMVGMDFELPVKFKKMQRPWDYPGPFALRKSR